MKLQVAQWGNSLAVRLPKAVQEDLRLSPGSELDAWVRGGELHLRPIPPVRKFRLEELLEQMTPDSIPEVEEWPFVGAEVIRDDFSR